MFKKWKIAVYTILGLIMIISCLMLVPQIRERVTYHFDNLFTRVYYILYPPEKAVFVPNTPVATIENLPATLQPTDIPTATLLPEEETPTPEPTPTMLPEKVTLDGVRYIDQHGLFNYCAPANLAMELSYWGWSGDRTDIGPVIKPYPEDFNVMLYEMADYVNEYTDLSALWRYGGSLDLLKALIAGKYPILIETGRYMVDVTGKLSWMGHYTVVTAYDDSLQEVITQDSYYEPDYAVAYTDLVKEWRPFNYSFLIVYSPEKEQELYGLLGDYVDEEESNRIAYNNASEEIWSLSGVDQYFAWFNRGTSQVALKDYYGAAESYDRAFLVYESLPESDRPYRMMWYQTGPYFAYYTTGRYQDVINLANQTFDTARLKILEESFVWRGRAEAALGDMAAAKEDLCASLEYHEGFLPALQEIEQLGFSDCP
jgi:hypothetical protein